MKKDKRLQFILLIAAVGVWGTLGYRLFNFTKKGEETENATGNFSILNTVSNNETDSFQLNLQYSDPFLSKGNEVMGHINMKDSNSENDNQNTNRRQLSGILSVPKPPTAVKAEKPFPIIIYKGFAMKEGGEVLARIVINNKNYIMHTTEQHDSIVLLNIQKDSITVSRGEQSKVIKRNKSN